MYLHGEFVNKTGNVISVEIMTRGLKLPEYEIGADYPGIYFPSEDPVVIDSEVNDTFDVLLTHSATIRLESKIALHELYSPDCTSAVVNIRRDGECIFAGYIEPQSYDQPFNEYTDIVEINCIDVLSAMQYSLYGGVGETSETYARLKMGSRVRSFDEIIREAFGKYTGTLNISGEETPSVLFDGSRTRSQKGTATEIFAKTGINELLFLGDTEDDTWSSQDVMSEILRYLGLHVEQEGFNFYLYSWQRAKNDVSAIVWSNLIGGGASDNWKRKSEREITKDIVADMASKFSIGESYNLIQLKCDLKDFENLIVSPLSEDDLTSPYPRRQKYATCIAINKQSDSAKESELLRQFINSYNKNDFNEIYTEDGSLKDWYLRIKSNPYWRFNGNNGQDNYERYCQDGTLPQETLPNSISQWPLGTALLSLGSVELAHPKGDNSLPDSIDMTDYFVITVNGLNNVVDFDSLLMNNAPVAEYTGKGSGTLLTPADDDTTNYIVIGGSIKMTPIIKSGNRYNTENAPTNDNGIYFPNLDYKYFNRYFHAAGTPGIIETATNGLNLPDELDLKYYEFSYSSVGDDADHVSKLGVIACMLIVGDKCLVETGTEGKVSDFRWQSYKRRENCASDDEYYAQSFTIGIDPKTGDYLIGTEFDIQNNISFDLGIEAKGMAIPIRKSDNLSGEVTFQILGPVNIVWDEITYRHRTWFRKAKWTSSSVALLNHIQNIYLKDFEIKLYSDNGLLELNDNCDLIYMSDTDEKYVNKKDDLTFRINSALTAEERASLEISTDLKLSTAIDLERNEGVMEIYNTDAGDTGKPEQFYVDEAWREWHKPRIVFEQNVIESKAYLHRFDIFTHPAIEGKRFFIQGISRNLMEGEALLTLKEATDD